MGGKIKRNNILFIIYAAVMIIGLILMYVSSYGIPGIIKYYNGFILPDMSFGYTYEMINNIFNNLGIYGLEQYSYYYAIDFVFILGFAGVQWSLCDKWVKKDHFLNKLCKVLVVMRGVFDLAEDVIFMFMIKSILPVSMYVVNIASIITEIKFIIMGLWMVSFILNIKSLKKFGINYIK